MLDNTLIKKWFWDSQSKKNQKYRMGVVLGIVILYFLLFMYMETHSNDGILLFIFLYFVIAAILLKMMVDFGRLEKQMEQINQGNLDHNRIEAFMLPWMRHFSEELEHVGEGLKAAVDEQMKSEHFKTELITNVSHDIKTPLTSIINYVDLLKNGTETTEEREEYLAVLDRQSKKLKKMTEDLVQFSKANTGNLELFMEHMHVDVLLEQVLGEYAEKLKEKKLEIIISLHRRNQDQKEIRIFSGDEIQIETEEGSTVVDDSFMIQGDGRYVWRILDNLFGNLYKYAMDGTRVYIDLVEKEQEIQISIKNTSKNPLNISGEELKERFVRGDSSRNTEGSGLGLSIAESFTVLMGGSFDVYVDGDFFKVSISFLKTDHTLE